MPARQRKLILRCHLSPGDIVMLTAAVRDLHGCHPGEFLTDVRTLCPELWENNPLITPLADEDPDAEIIDCEYPLINEANRLPWHCLHGFIQFLSARLQRDIRLTRPAGDIHLSAQEKAWMSQVHESAGRDIPFWIISAGGKFDVTIKWWSRERWQQVVDHFRGRIQFVQVGKAGHYHPLIEGVIDLRGRTNLRQLVRLVYHAQGVLCPVTCLMHLAAAVESKPGYAPHRPCVVVAGGREPVHWEAYPHHQFLHTVGALPCCERGGCWKSRTFPLHDGQSSDRALCVDVTDELPRCMHLIQPEDVVRAIEKYFDGGMARYLTADELSAAQQSVPRIRPRRTDGLTPFTARAEGERFIRTLSEAAPEFHGRGIIIPAGGPKYLTCAWVCINMLRHVGCRLPIELWHLGPDELDDTYRALVAGLGVTYVDAHAVRKRFSARILNGWELKAFALCYCHFQEVLLLDADNVPVKNPEELFETEEFRDTGAVFWPDFLRLHPQRTIWRLCGVSWRDEPEFESGEILVDKSRCWRALRLALWYNEHSDFFYRHIHGDKETFHMAFRKLDMPYAMPETPVLPLDGVMCQHNFRGERIFQHRNSHKWRLDEDNERVPGFLLEDRCLEFLRVLRDAWNPDSPRSEPPCADGHHQKTAQLSC